VAFQALSPTDARSASGQGIPITSTLNGYLQDLLVDEGNYVTAGQAIATVSSNQRLRLEADLPEKHAATLSQIQSASFRTSGSSKHYDLSALNGRLVSYARAL